MMLHGLTNKIPNLGKGKIMTKFGFIRQIIISCPSDCDNLALKSLDVINSINFQNEISNEILNPVYWKQNTYPNFNKDGVQEEINKQILYKSDILIAIFKNTIGTPTNNYISGCVEEIKRHIDAGKDTIVFFLSNEEKLDLELINFKKLFRKNSIYVEYNNEYDFCNKLKIKLQTLLVKSPISEKERVLSLINNPSIKDRLRERTGYEYKFKSIDFNGNDIQLKVQSFKLEKINNHTYEWVTNNDIVISHSEKKVSQNELINILDNELTNSFKFYLLVPYNEQYITRYTNMLVNNDAVVTGFGEVDKNPKLWRIWFLHNDGYIHPFLSKTFMANHSLIDLSGF